MTRESGSWEGKIESLTHEGLGVGTVILKKAGKLLRRPIFVPLTVPGDVILADVTDKKRKYLFGEVSAVLKESPERTMPRCRHFGTCGGCNLQHVSYDEQLRQKAKQVGYLLKRKGIALPKEIETLRSEAPQCYRWRARIAARFTGTGCIAGFRKAKSDEIVRVEECYIVHGRITDVIRLMNRAGTGLDDLEVEVTAVVGQRNKVGLLVDLEDVPAGKRQGVKTFFEELYARNRAVIGNVFFRENDRVRSYGQVQEHFTYEADDMTFSFLPENFIQANIPTNRTLIATVVEFLGRSPGVVVDLYAGIGNLSLPIAKRAERVVAVEGNEQSVLAGTTNALRNGVENVTFSQHSVERYVREFAKRYRSGNYSDTYPKADVIVLDPPRTGLTPGVIKGLLSAGLDRLLYVSCNPVKLADDLKDLSKKYAIKDIVCIDMFPDTPHVETVVLLER